jgi:hypothetical protein
VKIGNIISDVLEAVADRSGKAIDEVSTSERAVYNKVKENRIYIMRQKRKNGRDYTAYDTMTIPCVELIEANLSECLWLPTDGYMVKRTKYPLPRTLEGVLTTVGTLNFANTYDYRSIARISDLTGGRFPQLALNNIYTTQNIDGEMYVYILNDIHKEGIAIRLIPEDPLEVMEFPYCGKVMNKECLDPYEQEFPIDADLLKVVSEMTVEYFLSRQAPVADIKQNLSDETATPPTNIK